MLWQMKPGLLLTLLCVAIGWRNTDALMAQTQLPSPTRTNSPESAVALQIETQKRFQVRRGFRLELVAAEPLVANPIAMTFDENGRLFVLESTGGADGVEASQGRVRLLEDTDGNGIFDASTVYAENIPSPTALACYNSGLFVASAGQILYLKDTNGDGVAEVRREAFKSFGETTNGASGQVAISGLAWGLDNRIHAVTKSRGGDVISSSSPAQSVVLSEGSFSFDPRTFILTAESGSGASGMCFDDRGRKFICLANGTVQLVLSDPRYLPQDSGKEMRELPREIINGFSNLIYPLAHGSVATAPVRSVAASGLAIYRGNAFPAEYLGDVFMPDSAANIVHHEKLRPNGIGMSAERPTDESGMEFLAGRDDSFQPTQVINAPDGTLYVAGLTRETAAVPKARTNGVVADVPAKGRIYRIVPANFKQPKLPQLGNATAEQLVTTLRHSNGWHRDTAARLLYERQDRATVVPLIRLLFDPLAPPLARMHALRALDGIQLTVQGRPTRALLESHLLKALADADDRVREQAVLLSEKFISKDGLWPDAVWEQLSKMGGDPSPLVRWQLALTLGLGRNPGRVQPLADIVRADVSTWPAVLNSLNEGAAEMFERVSSDPQMHNTRVGQTFLHKLIWRVGRTNSPGEISQVVTALQGTGAMTCPLFNELETAVAAEDKSVAGIIGANALNPLYARATATVTDSSMDGFTRAEALRLLATRDSVDGALAVALANGWPYQSSRESRQSLLYGLMARPRWLDVVMTALETGLIQRTELNTEQIRFLLAYPNPNLRAQAAALFANWNALQRQPVVNRYQAALQMTANLGRGRELFLEHCQTCHHSADGNASAGHSISLAEVSRLGKERMLADILNPNRKPPAHSLTLVEMKNHELLAGFVVAQSAKCITLCDPQGIIKNAAHSYIQAQFDLGFSAMPEDWESRFSLQDMADLLEYLTASRK